MGSNPIGNTIPVITKTNLCEPYNEGSVDSKSYMLGLIKAGWNLAYPESVHGTDEDEEDGKRDSDENHVIAETGAVQEVGWDFIL